MKKLLCLTLAICLMLCFTACGGPDDDILGTISGQRYKNDFFDFQTRLPSDWDVYSFQETSQFMLGKSLNADQLLENLKETGMTYPFYATKDNGMSSVNIVIEKLSPASLSEQGYANVAVKQVPATLQTIGMTNVEAEITSVTFADELHVAVEVYGEFSGTPFYETVVCVKEEGYMCCITVGSFDAATVESILDGFWEY